MSRVEARRRLRPPLAVAVLFACFWLIPGGPGGSVRADTCADGCANEYGSCTSYCDSQANDCWNWGMFGCDEMRQSCSSGCSSQYDSCTAACPPVGGGGGSPGDGHIWCDGWNRQNACALQQPGVAGSVVLRRQRGNNGYDFQTFLSTHPAEMNGFGRFPVQDGNVGLVSSSPLAGQVPLHRWSTRRGFYYSIYNVNHGSEYVYGGIAAYVWPPGDQRGFPLYQFYSQQYGHYYTNYARNEISCQPGSWSFQGEMARVNWPAPAAQAARVCQTLGPFPRPCDPFDALICRQRGLFFDSNTCTCF